jgi:hypothetical protein
MWSVPGTPKTGGEGRGGVGGGVHHFSKKKSCQSFDMVKIFSIFLFFLEGKINNNNNSEGK